jgi:hypothetical protein
MKRPLAFLIYVLGLTSIAHAAPLASDEFAEAFRQSFAGGTTDTFRLLLKTISSWLLRRRMENDPVHF